MNLYDVTVPHVAKSLKNLAAWIDKAHEHAKSKKFDPNELLTARLAPDQFTLARQIMTVCDNGKFIVSRTLGKDAPTHPDTQTTFEELRARMEDVRKYVSGFERRHFEGAEDRLVTLSCAKSKA